MGKVAAALAEEGGAKCRLIPLMNQDKGMGDKGIRFPCPHSPAVPSPRRRPEFEERKQREPESPAVAVEFREGQVEARPGRREEMARFKISGLTPTGGRTQLRAIELTAA
jgi:hypothetical protein